MQRVYLGIERPDGSLYEIGDRIVCDSHQAVIKFIGEVPPTPGNIFNASSLIKLFWRYVCL